MVIVQQWGKALAVVYCIPYSTVQASLPTTSRTSGLKEPMWSVPAVRGILCRGPFKAPETAEGMLANESVMRCVGLGDDHRLAAMRDTSTSGDRL
jgi:hypothetical protein